QPGLGVGSPLEVAEGAKRSEQGLLQHIGGVLRTADETARHAIQRLHVGRCDRFEFDTRIVHERPPGRVIALPGRPQYTEERGGPPAGTFRVASTVEGRAGWRRNGPVTRCHRAECHARRDERRCRAGAAGHLNSKGGESMLRHRTFSVLLLSVLTTAALFWPALA